MYSGKFSTSMKFVCTKEHLQKALKGVGGVAGRNPALPILRHVLVKTERGKLRLAATDLEVGVVTWVAGKIEDSEGTLTIPLKQLTEYVVNLPSDHIHLSTNKGTLTVTCASAHASFQGETAENFPLIPTVKGGQRFTVKAPDLMSVLDRTVYAAAADDARPELSGILLHGKETVVTVAATDSYRLAESHIRLAEPLEKEFQLILPLRAAQELRRILEGEESATLTLGDGQILVETPTMHLVSRLIDGTYPDYTQIIPPKTPITISLLRHDLLRAIRAAGIFTSGEANSVLLETAPTSLRVTATAQELGETVTEVPADVHGDAASIHFNHRFLLDALTVFPSERVRLGLTNASVPVVLRPEGSDEQTLALVMPIKT